jgi:hypothetical protein
MKKSAYKTLLAASYKTGWNIESELDVLCSFIDSLDDGVGKLEIFLNKRVEEELGDSDDQ